MKTEAQLRSLELNSLQHAKRGNRCPTCGATKVYVIESRKTSSATRRRKQCAACGWRTTTYEVDASKYQRLLQLEKVATAIRPLLDELPPIDENKCDNCVFNDSSACNHGLPEFQSEEAYDCLYFKGKPN